MAACPASVLLTHTVLAVSDPAIRHNCSLSRRLRWKRLCDLHPWLLLTWRQHDSARSCVPAVPRKLHLHHQRRHELHRRAALNWQGRLLRASGLALRLPLSNPSNVWAGRHRDFGPLTRAKPPPNVCAGCRPGFGAPSATSTLCIQCKRGTYSAGGAAGFERPTCQSWCVCGGLDGCVRCSPASSASHVPQAAPADLDHLASCCSHFVSLISP